MSLIIFFQILNSLHLTEWVKIQKMYQVLELEHLQQRRWMRRLCLFYKVFSTKVPAYIYDFIPPVRLSQRHQNTFNSFSSRAENFKNSFFPCATGEWNKLNPEIGSSGSYNTFRKSLLNFIQSSASNVSNINDTIGSKLIIRLCYLALVIYENTNSNIISKTH